MSERCPLTGNSHAVGKLPDICLRQCVELWEYALKNQAPVLDDYLADTDSCRHGPIAFSHEALQSFDGSSRRIYSIVDQCEDCETEVMEASYTFSCPYN